MPTLAERIGQIEEKLEEMDTVPDLQAMGSLLRELFEIYLEAIQEMEASQTGLKNTQRRVTRRLKRAEREGGF